MIGLNVADVVGPACCYEGGGWRRLALEGGGWRVFMMPTYICPVEVYVTRTMRDFQFQEIIFMIFQIYHDEVMDFDKRTLNFSWLVITTRCLIVTVVTIGLLYIALVICREILVTCRIIALNLLAAIFSAIIELWNAFNSFLRVLCDASREVWNHMTRENINLIAALAILVYALPEILNMCIEILKKNVVIWGSRTTLKG